MANLVLAQVPSGVRAARIAAPGAGGIAAAIGFAGTAGALGFMVLLHVLAGAQIRPVTETLSGAAFAPGVGWMFPVGVLSMALAGVGALLSLRASRLNPGWFGTLAVSLAALGLVLVALFPTDVVGAASLSAQIHRYAAAVVMFAVPIAGFAVAAAMRGRPALTGARRLLVAGGLLTVAVVIVTGIAIFLPGVFEPVRGLIQRGLLFSELTLLALLVYLPPRAGASAS